MVAQPTMNNLSTKFSDNYDIKDELGKYVFKIDSDQKLFLSISEVHFPS